MGHGHDFGKKKTWHEPWGHNKELLDLFLVYNSTTDTEIFADYYKPLLNQ